MGIHCFFGGGFHQHFLRGLGFKPPLSGDLFNQQVWGRFQGKELSNYIVNRCNPQIGKFDGENSDKH